MSQLTVDDLDVLRTVGDPKLELEVKWAPRTAANYLRHIRTHGFEEPTEYELKEDWKNAVKVVGNPPLDEHLETLKMARHLLHTYGPEICAALLLAALPEAYAAKWGARVLAATRVLAGGSGDDAQLRSRIHGTITFLMQVIGPTGHIRHAWRADGPTLQCVVALRLLHHAIRTTQTSMANPKTKDELGAENWDPDKPVNQEDLLATRLTFVVTVFEVLEKFGITWSEDEQHAWIDVWDLIGGLLGICDTEALDKAGDEVTVRGRTYPARYIDPAATRPATADAARALMWQLRDRQWEPVPAFRPEDAREDRSALSWIPIPRGASSRPFADELEPGRLLTHALINELASAMPKPYQSWPLALMRQLAPARVVRDRLGLGSSGVVLTTFHHLPRRRVPVGRFTGLQVENPVNAKVLRMMGRRVALHASINFLTTQRGFVMPGVHLGHSTDPRRPSPHSTAPSG